ncbi:uncharacterized protein [Clytia hemisphaerica]|uniref:Uncharacterized protein n=1 Tax=Clytia hemisphaerica TaxID=252671 RepID=A0A7M5WZJ6_9CNID
MELIKLFVTTLFLSVIPYIACSYVDLNLFCEEYSDGLIDVACVEKVGNTQHMKKLIYNGRNDIDWERYGKSIKRILCKCNELVKKSGKKYLTLGIQFYGECWVSEHRVEDILKEVPKSKLCVNHKYKACKPRSFHQKAAGRNGYEIKVNTHACAGNDKSTALYTYYHLHEIQIEVLEEAKETEWTSWTTCSKSCGKGYQERSRTACEMVSGVHRCDVMKVDRRECNYQSCALTEPAKAAFRPINGGFSEWTSWTPCVCGNTAPSIRTRKCDNPKPQNSGKNCVGEPFQMKLCKYEEC